MESRRLTRSRTNQMVGVCAGLGNYLNVDPTAIRLIFILLVLLGASGILIYLILWIMPLESEGPLPPMQPPVPPSQ